MLSIVIQPALMVAGIAAAWLAGRILRLLRALWRSSLFRGGNRRASDELQVNGLPMGWAVGGWLLLGVLLVGGTGFGAYVLLGRPRLPTASAFSTSELLDLLKIALSVVAGFGGVVALTVAYRRQRVAEATHRLALIQEQREHGKLLHERFGAASANLGDDRFPTRLAGVHALTALADESLEQRQQCVDILCAYLRTPYPDGDPAEREVRNAVISVLLDRMGRFSSASWEDINIDLRGAQFVDLDLSDITFSATTNFDRAVFLGDHTRFDGAEFAANRTSFRGAKFTAGHTSFRGATFAGQHVTFAGAVLTGAVDFSNVRVRLAWLDFSGARLAGAVVDFTDLVLSNGTLDLTDADLDTAQLLIDPKHHEGRLLGFPAPENGPRGGTTTD
ncbi:pentapeptide repeat-containing protein [Solihabitans fulvus]|uniref:Pentapeptide repeat-containing protein n=1 Tax=Solihabitans fulvus TaxID=1892852 RepID=A0A5B2XHZ7_9PSEU|nr:pentapeptide repeat-containing protein [Solihabitans fulvus]KAA2263458.1 pentapeptide repeat-containing protein [Solihabitans fulvus]